MKRTLVVVFIVLTLASCMYTRPVTKDDYRPITNLTSWTVVVPGLAQILNGEYLKGSLFFIATVVPMVVAENVWGNGSGDGRPGYETPYRITNAIGSSAYIWSMVDGIGTTSRYAEQRRAIDIEMSPFTETEKGAISSHSVFIGMSSQAVLASLGKPQRVNRTTGSWGVHEQWVYGTGRYVYIENGYVSAWQD